MLAEIAQMRDQQVSDQELADAKRTIIASFALSLESATQLLNYSVTSWRYKLPADYWDKVPDRVAAVTRQQVQAIAQKYLVAPRMQIIAVGDPTRAGDYSFRITGTIAGQAIDERFESGPGRFDEVQPLTAVQKAWDGYGNAAHNDRWTGGQLAGSAALPDGRTVFSFYTSYLGTVKNGSRPANAPSVNNLLVVSDRKGIPSKTLVGKANTDLFPAPAPGRTCPPSVERCSTPSSTPLCSAGCGGGGVHLS